MVDVILYTEKQIKFPRTTLFIFFCYEGNGVSQLLGSPISPVHRVGKHDLLDRHDSGTNDHRLASFVAGDDYA